MSENESVYCTVADNGVAELVLNRPEKRNAFDDQIISDAIVLLNDIAENKNIKVLVVKSAGKQFSAGADLNWMKRMVNLDYAGNKADALQLAKLMRSLNDLPQPTIAEVQGAAYGGAVGLVACCDIAIASEHASFCLSEVKIGLAPAVISPYVVAKIGQSAARRYFLTAEVFNATTAADLSLVHQVVAPGQLSDRVVEFTQLLLKNGPRAMQGTKQLIAEVANTANNIDVDDYTSDLISRLRVSDEGQEGLASFLEKRDVVWPK